MNWALIHMMPSSTVKPIEWMGFYLPERNITMNNINDIEMELKEEREKKTLLEKENLELKERLRKAEADKRRLNEIIGNLNIDKSELLSKLKNLEARLLAEN